jgi:hypothetical protein
MNLFITYASLMLLFFVHGEKPTPISRVVSGNAELRQIGRLTLLELRNKQGKTQHIALTHPSDYSERAYAPFEAKLITESPNHFLIFTDSFESNPANVQGMCGASETGEKFVHVVALGTYPHETLSVQVESCLSFIELLKDPEWKFHKTSGGSVGSLTLNFDSDPKQTLVYFVSADGSVGRPTMKAEP